MPGHEMEPMSREEVERALLEERARSQVLEASLAREKRDADVLRGEAERLQERLSESLQSEHEYQGYMQHVNGEVGRVADDLERMATRSQGLELQMTSLTEAFAQYRAVVGERITQLEALLAVAKAQGFLAEEGSS